MSAEPDNIPEPDDLHDRLIDASLRELLGAQSPPDLSAKILAAASAPATTQAPAALITAGGSPMYASDRPHAKSAFPWFSLAIAVALLLGVGFLLMPPRQGHDLAQQVDAVGDTESVDAKSAENLK